MRLSKPHLVFASVDIRSDWSRVTPHSSLMYPDNIFCLLLDADIPNNAFERVLRSLKLLVQRAYPFIKFRLIRVTPFLFPSTLGPSGLLVGRSGSPNTINYDRDDLAI